MSIRRGNKILASSTTNGFSLFDCKWADHILNNISWLRADTFSWQSGNVYVAAYEHLADDIAVSDDGYITTENGVVFNRDSSKDKDGLIAWTSTNSTTIYTSNPPIIGERPSAWDDNRQIWGVYSLTISSGSNVAYQDVISNITITYYKAEDGHKICLPDQESNIVALYEKTGAADYYILDTTNKQFKLPRKQKRTLIQAVKNTNGTWYNLYSDGWVEQGGLITNTTVYTLPVTMANTNYYVSVTWDGGKSQNFYPIDFQVRNLTTTTFTTTASRDGSNVQGRCWQVKGYAAESAYASAGMRLEYYYVGNFEQTAIEQTAGINTELFNNKADLNLSNTTSNIDFVVESQLPTSANGYTWYRKYKSGWVEQGGRTDITTGNNNITLPIPMLDVNYTALVTRNSGASSTGQIDVWRKTSNDTTTTFCVYAVNNTGAIWSVAGMAA